MTTFHSDVVSIYAPSIGATMRFEDGTYSTDDPDEIRVLRGHGDVTEAPASPKARRARRAEATNEPAEAGDEPSTD